MSVAVENPDDATALIKKVESEHVPTLSNSVAARSTFASKLLYWPIKFFDAGEELARRRPLLFAFCHVPIWFAIILTVFTVGFDTNDDSVMNMFVSGKGISLQPDEHLVFTNVIVGLTLKKLYEFSATVPWYGIYLYSTHFFACTAILYCMIYSRYTRLKLLMYASYFLTIQLYFLVNVQFTATAALAGISGIFLLYRAWDESAGKSLPTFQRRAIVVWGCAMILLGGLIRHDVFFMTMALGFPMLVLQCWMQEKRAMRLLHCGIVGAVLSGLFAGAVVYNNQYYAKDPAWANFYKYNQLRVKFNDESWIYYAPETEHVFKAVDWKQIDFTMMKCWFYDSTEVFGADKLTKVLNGYEWQKDRVSVERFLLTFDELRKNRAVQAIVLMLPFVLFLVERTKRNLLLISAACAVTIGFLILVTVLSKVPPPRVYIPIMLFPHLVAMLHLQNGPRFFSQGVPKLVLSLYASQRNKVRDLFHFQPYMIVTRLIVAMFIFGVCVQSYSQYRRSRERIKENVRYHELLSQLKQDKDKLYVCWSCHFPYESISPFSFNKELNDIHLLALGWPQHTPFNERMKQHFGIKDIAQDFYKNKNVVQITGDFSVDALGCYVAEHYNTVVSSITTYKDPRCSLTRSIKELPEWNDSYSNQYLFTAKQSTDVLQK